jgi:hypothetical protein
VYEVKDKEICEESDLPGRDSIRVFPEYISRAIWLNQIPSFSRDEVRELGDWTGPKTTVDVVCTEKSRCFGRKSNGILMTVTDWMIGSSSLGRGWECFSSPQCPHCPWGPPSLLSTGYQGALSLGVKRPGREADHPPPSSAEVKKCVELYFPSPNTPSCCGAQLKNRTASHLFLCLHR